MITFFVSVCALVSGQVYPLTASTTFTLSWMHSVEKIQWEEDWQLRDNRFYPVAARIRGSGAGMDPPDNAVYHQGYWQYQPQLPPQAELKITHSPFTEGYLFCENNDCQLLAEKIPLTDDDNLIVIQPCNGINQ